MNAFAAGYAGPWRTRACFAFKISRKCWRATDGLTGACGPDAAGLGGGGDGLRSGGRAATGGGVFFTTLAGAGVIDGCARTGSVTLCVSTLLAVTLLAVAGLADAFCTATFFGGALLATTVLGAAFFGATFVGATFFASFLAAFVVTFLAAFRTADLLAAAFFGAFFGGARLVPARACGRAVFARADVFARPDVLRADDFFDLLGLIAHLRSSARRNSRGRKGLSIKISLYAS